MKMPSEPIRKEMICQNLTEAFGKELGFSIYYCKAAPPPPKKIGGPFTIVDVTLNDVSIRRSADPPTPADRKGERVREKELAAPLLELFRPSLPWGFATGSGSLFGAATALGTVQEGQQQQQERRAFPCARQLLQKALCTCHTKSGGHARSSSSHERQPRASRRPRAQQLLQKALCTASATRKPAVAQRRPRAQQLLQKALCPAPATPRPCVL